MLNTNSITDAKLIAKIIHEQLTNPSQEVTNALRDLFLVDSVDMTKDEFLDNFDHNNLQTPAAKEFLEKTNTAQFYKSRANAYAKDLTIDYCNQLEENINNSTFEVLSSVQSSLKVSLHTSQG